MADSPQRAVEEKVDAAGEDHGTSTNRSRPRGLETPRYLKHLPREVNVPARNSGPRRRGGNVATLSPGWWTRASHREGLDVILVLKEVRRA